MEAIIQGEPVAKQRPRVTRQGYTYTPKRTREAQDRIGWEWRLQNPGGQVITTHPVAVVVEFYYAGRDKDLDNLAKCVLDALNGVAWADDRQVTTLLAKKTKSRTPQTIVRVLEDTNWEASNEHISAAR